MGRIYIRKWVRHRRWKNKKCYPTVDGLMLKKILRDYPRGLKREISNFSLKLHTCLCLCH